MSTETKIPSIPSITQSNLTEVARAVKGILDVREGRSGNRLDSNVTFRDLVLAGFAQVASGALEAAGSPVVPVGTPAPGTYNPSKDMTVPPQPSGVVATGAFTTIMVEWDQPAYGNHAYAEVWASDSDVIGNAVMIGVTSRSVYVDAVGEPSFERYYWVRFVSAANVIGAYNSTSGTYAKTATDVSGALTALAGQISESELSESLSTRIDLIDGPDSAPGTVAYRIAQEAAARLLAISQEASARALAIADEASVRAQAILNEASARASADSALQTQINTLTAASSGDLSDLMAALQEEQAARIAGDSAEASSRQTLAAQMRGNYTGTDISQVTTGLLFSEAQARADADEAISTSVTTLSATVATKNKTYRQPSEPSSGMTAGDVWYDSDDGNKPYRYSGSAWVATDDARIAANSAAITTEQTARANADSALASQITTLTATVGGNTASIQQETAARVNADSALQTQINTLSAASANDVSALLSAIQEEQTARTNGDAAEASARQTLATQMRGNYSGTDIAQLSSGLLFSEVQARTTADGVLTQSISSLQATVDSNLTSVNAAISAEQTARANADTALSGSIATLTASVNTKNKTYRQAAAPTSGMTAGDVWYDSDDSNKPYRYSGTAWVATDDTRIATNAAAISAEQTARANADSALATQINTLTASVSGNTAAIQQEATARATETGELFAKYTVKVDVAGHVSGIGLASTANNANPSSSFLVRADQFAVTPPSFSSTTAPTANLYKGMVWIDTSVTPNVTRYYTGSAWSTTPQALPFVIQATPTTLNGVNVAPGVYMPAAFIMDGSIGNVKIGNAAIDDAKVANLSAAKLTAGDGTIGGVLKSENYVPGSSGWAVLRTGGAEFSGVTVRGTVYAGSGSIGGILLGADHIRSSGFVFGSTGFYLGTDGTAVLGKGMTLDSAGNVTFTGQLNGATGTFSGNLSAAGGTFNGQLDVKSASSGARMEIKNNVIKVYDESGVLRVQIGDLTA